MTVLPYLTGMSGMFYLFGALLLGGGFLYYALKLKLDAAQRRARCRRSAIRSAYLMALFSFLLVDHYIPALWP